MVYAYDRNIQMPTKDLYDTQIMAMAVAAAKDEYEKAEKRLDDLNKLYGDFYSPSDVDMQNWQTYVVSPIKDKLDELYAKGIDPTRSAEGRAILAKASRDLPYDTINRLKQGAAIGQEYLKNMAKLQAQGLYNPDYEERYLGYDIRNWDTLKNGVWNRLSPDPVPSLQDATVDWYKNRTARQITPEEMQALAAQGYSYDPMMNYKGWLESDALHVAGENVPGFAGTQVGGYYADLARQEVMQRAAAEGRDPKTITQDEINSQLAKNIAAANRQFLIMPTGELDPRALDDYRTANDIKAHRQKAAITAYYSNSGGGSGNGSYAEAPYRTKTRVFNEKLANLLGVDVTVVDDISKNGKFVHDRIIENQTSLASRYTNPDDLITSLSTEDSREYIAHMLGLKQVDDTDKQNNMYTMSKQELRHIVDANYIANRVKTSNPVLEAIQPKDYATTAMRGRLKSAYRNELKVEPTGRIITYLDKQDNVIKMRAELEIIGGGGRSGEIVYADLGNESTKVDGSNNPVGINETLSTGRNYDYEKLDKEKSSNQTKSILTSWNRQ